MELRSSGMNLICLVMLLLLNDLMAKSISIFPVGAYRTSFSIRIINSFFMWASYDLIDHSYSSRGIFLYERNYFFKNFFRFPYVVVACPFLHILWLFSLIHNNSTNNLRGPLIVWAIKGNCGNRITLPPLSCSFN